MDACAPMLRRLAVVTLAAGLLAACASAVPPPRLPSGGGDYKVGSPYKVDGVWYTPAEDDGYSEVGIASWYGSKFHGRRTANGEFFDMNALTAAHKTLPMPSAVQVTNLRNGRTLALRVNDRGPFVNGRIIDVSRRAAQLLGFERDGVAKVRVEIMPDESRRLAYIARYGKQPPEPRRVVTAERRTASEAIFVQVGAFSARKKAADLAARTATYGRTGISETDDRGARIYRVRLGPLASEAAALDLAERLLADGFEDLRIVVD